MQVQFIDSAPLSEFQHHWWQLAQRPGSAPNLFLAIRVVGPLNVPALESALADVIERNHSLRTAIFEEDGQAVSCLHEGPITCPKLTATRTTPISLANIIKSIPRKFALDQEIPLRVHLLVNSPLFHTLFLVAHPLAMDSWSVRPLINDLVLAYGSRCLGRAPRWRIPSVQYSHYASGQEQLLGDENDPGSSAAQPLAFWTRTLSSTRRVEVPSSWSARAGESTRATIRVNPVLHQKLIALGQRANASLLMVLHSAVARTLARLGVKGDVPMVTVVSARKHHSHRNIIGPLVNLLMIPPVDGGTGSFPDLLARVREAYIQAYSNADVEWGRVMAACKIPLDIVAPPRVMVTLQKRNRLALSADVAGARFKTEPLAPSMADCDLAFDFVERCDAKGRFGGIEGELRSNIAGLDKTYVAAIGTEFTEALKASLAYSDGLLDQACGTPCVSKTKDMAVAAKPKESGVPGDHRKEKSDFVSSPMMPYVNPYTVFIGAQDTTQDRLIHIWEELLGVERIGIWDRFGDLGGDVTLFHKMIEKIYDAYRLQLPIPVFDSDVTIAKLSDELARGVPEVPVLEIQPGNPHTSRPFWFFHGDFSGHGLYSRELSGFLDSCQPFYVLPPHGINGHPVPSSIEEMASDCLAFIRKIQPRGPLCLGGYCVGGLVALELAARLRNAGEEVDEIILIGAPLASAQSTTQPQSHAAAPLNSSDQFSRYVVAASNYKPKFYSGRATLLWPAEKPYPAYDPARRWKDVVEDLTVRSIDGGHTTCLTRHIRSLGMNLAGILAATGRSSRLAVVQ